MKRLILLLVLTLTLPLLAQNSGQATQVRNGSSLPATCDPTRGQIFFLTGDGLYSCTATNTWTKAGGGGLSGYTDAGVGTISSAITSAGTTGAVSIPPSNTDATPWTNPNNRPIFDSRRIGDFRGGRLSVLDFGADNKASYYQHSNMTIGTSLINTSTPVVPANGTRVCMSRAGTAGADLCGTIVSTGANTITMSANAVATVSPGGAYWGNDSTAAVQAAINYCQVSAAGNQWGGCEVDFPPGNYLISTSLATYVNTVYPVVGGIRFICPGGRRSTRLIWTGADQGAIISVPASGAPIDVEGCTFDSADFESETTYPGDGRKAGTAIAFAGGTQHRFINNVFLNLYEGIRGTSSWLNLVDHNDFYGPYNAAIHWYNGAVAPINSTTVSNNEFGFYHLHGLLSDSAASGGANGNFYFGNDFEGTSTDTISDVDINDNWGSFGPNRFETSGSLVGGYQALFLRGTYNNVQITFCGSGITIAGTDNIVACSNYSGALTDTGGFNLYVGGNPARSLNFTGSGAASAEILAGSRSNVYMDNGSFKILGATATDNARKGPVLQLGSVTGSGTSGATASATLSYGAPVLPNAPASSTFSLGDRIYPIDPGYGPAGYRSTLAFWECMGSSSATCTFSGGAWGGTGVLRSVPSYAAFHGESTAVPASGTSGQGDLVWKTNPSGTNPLIGWSVTAGGTPGTFAPIYAIDPANPPAWGATTPNTVKSTTLTASTASVTGNTSSQSFTGTASALTPDVIAGGPAAWFKADDGTSCTVDGTLTTTWNDSAATPHNASNAGGAARPTCKLSIVNGKPVMRFAGAQNFKTAAFTLNQPVTIFIVYQKAIGSNANDAMLDGNTGYSDAVVFQNAAGAGSATSIKAYAGANANAGTIVDDAAFHIVSAISNGASSSIYQDGTTLASGVNGGAGNMGGVTIGENGSLAVPFTGDIAEVIIYPSALSASDRSNVDFYLSTKYALPITDAIKPFSSNGYSVSASGKVSSAGAATGYTTVTFSATPVFDASTTNNFKITLTSNITSSTLSNATAGQILTFAYCQDATGGRTNVWPANVIGGGTINPAANACSRQVFRFNGSSAEALTAMVDDATGSGYVKGPPSATLNEIPAYGDVSGKSLLSGTGCTISSGVITCTRTGGIGDGFDLVEGTNDAAVAGHDVCNANSTAHGIQCSYNGDTALTLPRVVASGTATMGTGAITSGTCAAAVTVAATGVATTDTIQYTPNTDPTAITGYAPSASGSLYIWAYPTAGNVNFKVCNNTSGSITPAALTLNWKVTR